MKTIKRNSVILSLFLAAVLFFSCAQTAEAGGVTGDEAFNDLIWTEAFSAVPSAGGVLQSVVSTENYIITMENVADDLETKDVVTAYYKNNTDQYGNPVTQYSVALQNSDNNWEHCNGMAYNPKTHEIYVAPYTYFDNTNYGQILVMDPDTLAFKRKEYLTSDYAILGIAYDRDNDRYIVQGNADNNYGFAIYDANFDLVTDLGPADISPGTNSQDMEVYGDYIVNAPLVSDPVPDLNVYSISRNSKVATIRMNIPLDGVTYIEPESVTAVSAGDMLVAINVKTETDADKQFKFYRTSLPYNFTVMTYVENGSITATNSEVARGSDYTIEFKPDSGCALSSISVDGLQVDTGDVSNGYTLTDVQDNHQVVVKFVDKKQAKEDAKARKNAIGKLEKFVSKCTGGSGAAGKVILTIVIILVIILALLVAWYFIMLHIKRERRRRRRIAMEKRRRAREAQRRIDMMESYRDDPDEGMSIRDRKYDQFEFDESKYLDDDPDETEASKFSNGWPDENAENVSGHWLHGEWVSTMPEGPGEFD